MRGLITRVVEGAKVESRKVTDEQKHKEAMAFAIGLHKANPGRRFAISHNANTVGVWNDKVNRFTAAVEFVINGQWCFTGGQDYLINGKPAYTDDQWTEVPEPEPEAVAS